MMWLDCSVAMSSGITCEFDTAQCNPESSNLKTKVWRNLFEFDSMTDLFLGYDLGEVQILRGSRRFFDLLGD